MKKTIILIAVLLFVSSGVILRGQAAAPVDIKTSGNAITAGGQTRYNSDLIIEPVLKTDSTYIGQKINYPDFGDDEVTILKITFRPGKSTGWHKHEIPVFAYVLKGELKVELEDGRTIKFPESSSFSEVFNTWHNGTNSGKEDLVLMAFYLGRKGAALSVPRQPADQKSSPPLPK